MSRCARISLKWLDSGVTMFVDGPVQYLAAVLECGADSAIAPPSRWEDAVRAFREGLVSFVQREQCAMRLSNVSYRARRAWSVASSPGVRLGGGRRAPIPMLLPGTCAPETDAPVREGEVHADPVATDQVM
jgi:hypothetical protein